MLPKAAPCLVLPATSHTVESTSTTSRAETGPPPRDQARRSRLSGDGFELADMAEGEGAGRRPR